MTERPILFTPGNVRAILDGSKTQTRRIITSPSRTHDHFTLVDHGHGFWPYLSDDGESSVTDDGNETPIVCPYGTAEDRLWVREGLERSKNLIGVSYRRDGKPVGPMPTGGWYRWEWRRDTLSPIHMPKWACRLWLEIVEVRVERLQEISEEDAIAEGVTLHPAHHHRSRSSIYGPVATYRDLWESINGAGSWEQNPWVWVISFTRVTS